MNPIRDFVRTGKAVQEAEDSGELVDVEQRADDTASVTVELGTTRMTRVCDPDPDCLLVAANDVAVIALSMEAMKARSAANAGAGR